MNKLVEIVDILKKGVFVTNRNSINIIALLFCVMVLMTLVGCAERSIDLGKWRIQKEGHQFVFITPEEKKIINEGFKEKEKKLQKGNFRIISGRLKRTYSKFVKKIGETPTVYDSKIKPYSVFVIESGYSFLQVTKELGKDKLYDEVEWGWKITIENRSKYDIYAKVNYALLDKEGFILTKTNEASKNEVLIKSGTTETIQRVANWQVYSNSKPYTAKRVAKGDYSLFLRTEDIFDRLSP